MITVAHSPDADDFFLFWPLRQGLIPSGDYQFEFQELDTEDLNQAALEERFDICAISAAVYPKIALKHQILSSGASVGRKYGPKLVATNPADLESLADKLIGVPGPHTTAAALLRRVLPDCKTITIPLTPYSAVFEALGSGAIAAAVIIHEGQIAFAEHNAHAVLDLGVSWFDSTGLPIPLGLNVIHDRLGQKAVDELADLCKLSACYAREHQTELLPELFEFTQRKRNKLKTIAELTNYLGMYANQDSMDLPGDVKAALRELLGAEVNLRFTR